MPLPDRDDVTGAEGFARLAPGEAFNPILDCAGFARSQGRLSRWRAGIPMLRYLEHAQRGNRGRCADGRADQGIGARRQQRRLMRGGELHQEAVSS